MPQISLTASMRNNLLSLQNISGQVSLTQNRLATGKKVNSAIDNPSNFYTASSLSNRAKDLNALLDSMGQAISAIKASTEGLDTALTYLEQAAGTANQALMIDFASNDYQDFINEGYKEISSSMSKSEIQNLLVDNAKLILKDDIDLAEGLEITSSNVTIYGNGKAISVNGDNKSAIIVKGKNASADISNLKINVNGSGAYGIKATESGSITIDNLDNITVTGDGAQKYYYRNEDLFKGKEYTPEIYSQLSALDDLDNTAIDNTMKYYASGINSNDEYFGQGTWYLGAIGEWCDLFGFTYSDIEEKGTSGATRDVLIEINKTFEIMGDDATALNDNYWSSSEYHLNTMWGFVPSVGARGTGIKYNKNYVRCFNEIENCFDPKDENKPQIGYIMYSDKTWSAATDYTSQKANGKIAVGVVFDVDTISNSVKIVALEDACENEVNMGGYGTDFSNIPNYSSTIELKNTGNLVVTHQNSINQSVQKSLERQFSEILTEFDNIISDSSYKGINFIKGDNLKVIFNEHHTHNLMIKGMEIQCEKIGINTLEWSSITDVETSLNEITNAIAKIRNYQNNLGNNYSILTTRQDFTENLINILTEGADKLTLADMNEESANMLSLQTRQQLAINSLSLASQASQSVLKLF